MSADSCRAREQKQDQDQELSIRPAAGSSHFSLSGQRKVTKRKATPLLRRPGSCPSGSRDVAGVCDSASMHWRKRRCIHAPPPSGPSCATAPLQRGPVKPRAAAIHGRFGKIGASGSESFSSHCIAAFSIDSGSEFGASRLIGHAARKTINRGTPRRSVLSAAMPDGVESVFLLISISRQIRSAATDCVRNSHSFIPYNAQRRSGIHFLAGSLHRLGIAPAQSVPARGLP